MLFLLVLFMLFHSQFSDLNTKHVIDQHFISLKRHYIPTFKCIFKNPSQGAILFYRNINPDVTL